MQAGAVEPVGVLLHAGRDRRGDIDADEADRPGVHQIPVLRVAPDLGLTAPCRNCSRASSCAPPDGEDGPGGDLQAPQDQPAAPAAPGLSVSAEEDADRPAQSGLVRRHYLHPGVVRPLLPRGDHGLGHAQGVELVAVEHDACRLLR